MIWCNGVWKIKNIFGLYVNNELKFFEFKVKGIIYIIGVYEIINWEDIFFYSMLWRY